MKKFIILILFLLVSCSTTKYIKVNSTNYDEILLENYPDVYNKYKHGDISISSIYQCESGGYIVCYE